MKTLKNPILSGFFKNGSKIVAHKKYHKYVKKGLTKGLY